jgi:CotH kinase protein
MRRRASAFSGLRHVVAVAAVAMVPLIEAKPAAAADEIAWMFDPDAVVEVNLGGLSEEELDALEAEPDEYQKGTFELKVNGAPKGPELIDVGIRRKGGFGSSRPIKTGKSGLKLRFDEFVDDQLFFGIKRLTLNNMFQDESMVHETLTYELFHALELPASRTGYAFVNLNGAKYGLFLNVETLDEISLPQWFPTTGHLYEADAAGTDVRPGQAGTFEVDEGDDEDLSDLEALIATANGEAGDWSEGMEAVADLERMTAEWAVERYVGHWDGYAGAPEPTPDPEDPIRPNNYYLHSDEAGVFQLMPWGTDQTWEFPRGFEASASGLMFNKCLADASCRDLYLDGLTDIHCVNQQLDQSAHATQLAAMLDPYQDEEDEVRRGYTAAQIAEEVQSTEGFAEERAGSLEEHLTDEGRLGGAEDPCAEPEPEPEGPDDGPKGPGAGPAGGGASGAPSAGDVQALMSLRSLRVASDGTLVAVLRVDRAGAARLTGAIETRRGRRQVCAAGRKAEGAGRLTMHCRLSEPARARLRKRRLNVSLAIEFEPDDGSLAATITRSRIVPRTPRD